MSASSDALLAKSDAELRFFVDHPHFYQPELVQAAHRELHRRGATTAPVGPPPPPVPATPAPFAPPPPLVPPAASYPAPDYPAEYLDEPARPRPWLVPVLLVVVVLAAGTGLYRWFSATQQQQRTLAARSRARLSPDSLRLEEAAATPLPLVDADANISRQLAIVPAAERRQATAQQMQQYRGVSRRFWQAEQPTEFLLNQAAANQASNYAIFLDQVRLMEQQWHTSGNALVYTYHFPPTMADQVSRMRAVAGLERKILDHVKAQALASHPLTLSSKDQMDYATARELLHGITHELGTLQAQ